MRASVLFLLFLSFIAGTRLEAQSGFSLATDFGAIRNFKEGQKYWAAGQGVVAQVHLNKQEAIYALFAYYTYGKFENNYTASARSAATIPEQIGFINSAKLKTKNFSLGYKRWITGTGDAEKGWNTFATLGTGILLGDIENSFSAPIDTALYLAPVQTGAGNFKRLTLDLGLGIERPIGADIYIYSECRTYIPISDYPSPYLPPAKYAPLTASLCMGLRILF